MQPFQQSYPQPFQHSYPQQFQSYPQPWGFGQYHQHQQLLPSAGTAIMVQQGNPRAPLYIARDMFCRGLLIGTGLYLAGERKNLIKYSFAGAGMIELAVIALAFMNKK